MDAEPTQTKAEHVEVHDDEFADQGLPNTIPSGATVQADRRNAVAEHTADEPAPGTELDDAPESVSQSVAEAERKSAKLGANVRGEGQIMGSPE